MIQSINSLARRGTVALIGILGGLGTELVPNYFGPLFGKSATVRLVFASNYPKMLFWVIYWLAFREGESLDC